MPTLPLKDIPADIKKYILKVQGITKAKKGISQYSLCQTIVQIIKEHKEFSEPKNTA